MLDPTMVDPPTSLYSWSSHWKPCCWPCINYYIVI